MATLEHGLRQKQIQEGQGRINKKLAALALTGAMALGGIGIFAGSQQGEQTRPEPTPISGGIANPNETQKPATEATIQPAETENQGPEVDLGHFAVNTWLETLSSKQKSDKNDKFFNLSVENKEEWQVNVQKLDDGKTISDPLKVSWLGGYTSSWNDQGGTFVGHKVQGKVEFNNISFTAEDQQLSSADVANGVDYKGTVTINYVERYYNNYYEPSTSIGDENKENVVNWIHSKENQEDNFSDWNEGTFTLPVVFKNDKWEKDLGEVKKESQEDPVNAYNEFLVPFDTFYSVGCGPYEEFSCKTELKNPPYN